MRSRSILSGFAGTTALLLSLSCDDGSGTGGSGGATSSSGAPSTSSASGTASTGTTTSSASTTSSSSTGGMAGAPHVGAHGLAYYGYGANQNASIDSPALSTKPSGSVLVVSSGRGDLSAANAPTDNKGNAPFMALGTPHPYTLWPTSGTDVHAFVGAIGGDNHVVTTATAPGDEVTLAVVEVENGSHIQAAEWVERLKGQAITSAKVTTTGPATLVAFWWGDADVGGDKVATPSDGFVVLDAIGNAGALVQGFVAAKDVDAPGTYDVTWTATPDQGAQLWLVAVQ